MNHSSLIRRTRSRGRTLVTRAFLCLGSLTLTRSLVVSATLLMLFGWARPSAAEQPAVLTPQEAAPRASSSPRPQPTASKTPPTQARVVLDDPEEDPVTEAPPLPPPGNGGLAVSPYLGAGLVPRIVSTQPAQDDPGI